MSFAAKMIFIVIFLTFSRYKWLHLSNIKVFFPSKYTWVKLLLRHQHWPLPAILVSWTEVSNRVLCLMMLVTCVSYIIVHWWYLWNICTYDTFLCTLYTCFTLSIYVEHIFLMHELALKESCQRFELKKIKIQMHLPYKYSSSSLQILMNPALQICFFFSESTDIRRPTSFVFSKMQSVFIQTDRHFPELTT